MLKKPLPRYFRILIALLSGLLMPLAFAPFHLFFISILSVAALLALWLKTQSRKMAFWQGYAFGIGCFGAGISWVYISIQQFGGISPPISALLTLLFIAYLSLYPALCGYLMTRFFPENITAKYFCIFPFFWILLEWIRSFFMSGFPWLLIGYSQTNTWLSGYASILSVYGVSIATLMLSALIVFAAFGNRRRRILCTIFFACIWAGGLALSKITWTKSTGKTLTLSLIQGDIPQSLKWSPQHLKLSLRRYHQLTEQNWNSQLIIWPETAIPLPSYLLASFFERLNKQALAHHSSLITGALVLAPNHKDYYNAMLSLGNATGHYFKRRLVPFGETLPKLTLVKAVYRALKIPTPGLTRGPIAQTPMSVQGITFAPFICYEIAFPEQVRSFTRNKGFLLAISDDAWFGRSIAPWQHLQMAQMRAIETNRMLIFVGNSGITAIINANGQIIAQAKPFQVAVLHGKIHARTGLTPWQHYGFDSVIILLILLLVIGLKMRNTHRKRLRSE